MTAAVADFRPAKEAKQKLKRGAMGPNATIELVQNPDLLAELGKARGTAKTPLLVGFAAETEDVIGNAEKKLVTKRVDLVVANDVSEPGSGFAVDTNRVTLVDTSGAIEVPAGTKSEVAHRILDHVVAMRAAAAAAPARARAAKSPRAKSKRRCSLRSVALRCAALRCVALRSPPRCSRRI
jgi:phosphopantothenoylcysteine decarboxylase/phosphopantothenate--cysteine ligase